MSASYLQARDEIFTLFKNAWDVTTYPAFYEEVKKQRAATELPWAVLTLKHSGGNQITLGGVGASAFQRTGNLTVQIFTPIGKGLQEAYSLAKVVSDAYQNKSTPRGVWFRNIRLNEVGRDGQFYQLNVIIEFQYEEVA